MILANQGFANSIQMWGWVISLGEIFFLVVEIEGGLSLTVWTVFKVSFFWGEGGGLFVQNQEWRASVERGNKNLVCGFYWRVEQVREWAKFRLVGANPGKLFIQCNKDSCCDRKTMWLICGWNDTKKLNFLALGM